MTPPHPIAYRAPRRWLALAALALLAGGCDRRAERQPVIIFYAASLSRVLGELTDELGRARPELELRLEPSGSMVAARKVADLGRRADLVLCADWRVIQRVLLPRHADFVVRFAANELVLAHAEHSRYTDEIDERNWPEILTRPDVRLGRCDEHTAPLGFQTLQAWQLAAARIAPEAGADLLARLQARCQPTHVVPDVAELVALLESRAIDYAFVFRSVAEEHRLKFVRLPAEVNLGDPNRAADYARARVAVRLGGQVDASELVGAPIVYGLTIPRDAPNPAAAAQVAAELLGPRGRRLLGASGFSPLDPPGCSEPERLPEPLAGMVRGAGTP